MFDLQIYSGIGAAFAWMIVLLSTNRVAEQPSRTHAWVPAITKKKPTLQVYKLIKLLFYIYIPRFCSFINQALLVFD